MTQKHTTTLDTEIEELLKDYNGYDFCGEKACSGQNKANELIQAITTYLQQEIDKAKLQLLRDIKNSEGFGKMPIGMRDLLSTFSQDIATIRERSK